MLEVNKGIQQNIKPFNLKEFVEQLFESSKEQHVSGIHIRMDDNTILNVRIYESRGCVYVEMDGIAMGYFEPMTQRGYKCRFVQRYRVGIRKGLTRNELFMQNICETDEFIFLQKA